MNHNTARCSACNTICVLPRLRAKASAAKCEACARREAEKVRGSRAFETEPRDPFLNNMVGPPRGSFNNILKRVYADDFRITVPRDAVIYDDKREQRARELTEEKRREERWWQFETRVSWDREEFIYSTGYGTDCLKLKVTIDMDTLHKHLNAANGCYQDCHYLPDFEARFDAGGELIEMRKSARYVHAPSS